MRPLLTTALPLLLVLPACRSELDAVALDEDLALADTSTEQVVTDPVTCANEGAPTRAFDERGVELMDTVPEVEVGTPLTWTVPEEVAVLELCGTWEALLTVEHDLRILGHGDPEDSVLSGRHEGTPLTVRGATVTLERVTLADGVATDLDERDASSSDRGGALRAEDAELVVRDVVFSDNLARYGGSVALVDSQATFVDTTFWWGAAVVAGGALALEGDSHADVVDSSFFANQAGEGGAIEVRDSSILLDGVMMLENAAERGGGIYATDAASLVIRDSSIGHQHAEVGGALALERADARIRDTTFDENEASVRGGAIDATTARLTLRDTVLIYNSAGQVGGGLSADGSSVFGRDCVFVGNEAELGGDQYWQTGGDVELGSCLFVAETQ